MDFSFGYVDFDCTWSNPAISVAALIACAFAASLTWRIARSKLAAPARVALVTLVALVAELLDGPLESVFLRGELFFGDAASIAERLRNMRGLHVGCMTSSRWWNSPPLVIAVVAAFTLVVALKWPRR